MILSKATPDELKRSKRFYYVKFEDLSTIEDFELHLISFISSGAYYFNDHIIEARQLVDRINSLKIEIYSKEHAPPHFHVMLDGYKASFAIDDCEILENSGIGNREIRNIQDWFRRSKDKLIEVWNNTRPSDCQVGKIS